MTGPGGRRDCHLAKLKKRNHTSRGKMACQRMVSVSLRFGACFSALVIVTQKLPAKSNLSSVFGQDEVYMSKGAT